MHHPLYEQRGMEESIGGSDVIGYLKGRVAKLSADYCLLDVHGVGYRVFTGALTQKYLHLNEEAELFIHTAVREDAIILYGFHSQDEYDAFQLLISVSGIGPRVALGILSSISVDQLALAIQGKKTAVLTKLPGIGKKSAERIILELKDKISVPDGVGEQQDMGLEAVELMEEDVTSEAVAALVSLGYTQPEIQRVMKKAAAGKDVQEIIKLALKELNRF